MTNVHDLPSTPVSTSAPKAWRFADGKIVRGRKNEEEYLEAIVGVLKRVTIFYGELDTGAKYGKLEAELEGKDGPIVVGSSILSATNGRPTLSSSITFAQGLLLCGAGDAIQITCNAGKENKYGATPTYVNLSRLSQHPVTGEWRAISIRSNSDDPWSEDLLNDLLGKLKEHPAYADRPQRMSAEEEADNASGSAHYIKMASELARERGWVPPIADPEGWLSLLKAVANQRKEPAPATLEGASDAIWGAMLTGLQNSPAKPKALKAAPAPVEEDIDPFAE